jgi:hypothetical protein
MPAHQQLLLPRLSRLGNVRHSANSIWNCGLGGNAIVDKIVINHIW